MIKSIKFFLAPLLLSIALLPVASAQTLDAGVPAQLYIANTSDITSPVNVYVDGALFASNIFSGTDSTFAKTITTGTHSVVVTRNYQQPGTDDILATTLNVPSGGSTLTLENDMTKVNGFLTQTGYDLDLSDANQ